MGATVREIVDDALTVIGEIAGAGVEQYSEDRMMADTVRTFNLIWKKYFWDQYLQWFQFSLDGTLGIPATDVFTNVRDFEDFFFVGKDGERQPLPLLRKSINPYSITSTTSDLLYWSSLPVTDTHFRDRRLQFYSKNYTGVINVGARIYPIANGSNWDWDDTIDLDKDMIVNGVAYISLSSDDLNPGAADAQKNLMELRFRDIMAALANHPIAVANTGGAIPDQWYTTRY